MTLQIHYTIAMPQPTNHRFQLEIEVQGWKQEGAKLVLPAWTPGSYLLREFSRHVENVRAESLDGAPLLTQRVSKGTWHVGTRGAGFRVRYEVYANELTVRTSHLDATHGYFNGANVFMYLDGHKQHRVTLAIEEPEGWHSSIALPRTDQGDFEAASYDLLVDSPGEVGTHRVLRFEALGKPHEIALWGRGNEDETALVRDLKYIVEGVARLFDSEVPYERYLFIVHLGDRVGGGLEHLNSTTLAADRWTFAPRGEYEKFLRLASHEFFHVWNVKRIRPNNLGPFDYTQEAYTSLLWVMEGFTTYYDVLLLHRAGLISAQRCLQTYAERILTYWQQPGRHVQSLEESSMTAWIKFYRQDENYVNSGISYYLKGSLVALLLDLHLRAISHNQHSLDDVMRQLWEEYGRADIGFTVDEFFDAMESASQMDLSTYIERFVRGVEELPLAEGLAQAGLELIATRKSDSPKVWTGLLLKDEAEGLVVKNVLRDSPSEAGGLMARDRLLALDGYEIRDESFLTARLRERAPGDTVTFHLFRQGLLLDKQVTLAAAAPDHVTLRPRPDATPLQHQILESWLGTAWASLPARGEA